MKVGVLALQGAAPRHVAMLARLGAEPIAVRTPPQLDQVDGLVMPGGESTTMSMLLESSGLFDPLAERLAAGMPAFGTCAGMILLAGEILDGRGDQRSFGVMDIVVRRNAYGRQVDSFEADLAIPALSGAGVSGTGVSGTGGSGTGGSGTTVGAEPFHAVFIRAPLAERAGPAVEVLARVDDRPVLCRQGRMLAAAFHPELGDDPRIHELFLNEVM